MKRSNFFIPCLLLALWVATCNQEIPEEPPPSEAMLDSLEYEASRRLQKTIPLSVTPDVETEAVQALQGEDAADDPAIWIDRENPARSKIFGSNKRGGIAVYDLSGNELNYFAVGNINNIDVAYEFELGEQRMDLLGGSNRSDQSIDIFRIDPQTGDLQDISARPFLMDTTQMDDIYGFCFYQSPITKEVYAIANAKNGRVQQYLLQAAGDSLIDLRLVRELQFDSQVEGMVVDAFYQTLYVGEENRGIWQVAAEPDSSSEKTLVPRSDSTNAAIVYDIEGLAIYEIGAGGYLIASSQGNFSYALFDRQDQSYLGSFKIGPSEGVDGAEETDGVEVVSDSLSPLFPNGLLIVQDGFNTDGDTALPQNFKLVDWRKIQLLFR